MYSYSHSPADAQQAAKVAARARHQLHGLVVQHPEPAVLADQRQVLTTRGEGELVDGPRPMLVLVTGLARDLVLAVYTVKPSPPFWYWN